MCVFVNTRITELLFKIYGKLMKKIKDCTSSWKFRKKNKDYRLKIKWLMASLIVLLQQVH